MQRRLQLARSGQIWHDPAQIWPTGRFRLNLARTSSHFARIRPDPGDIGQVWPAFVQFLPRFDQAWAMSIKPGRCLCVPLAQRGRGTLIDARCGMFMVLNFGPNSARIRPMLSPGSAKLGRARPISTRLGPDSTKLGRVGLHSPRVRANIAQIPVNLAEFDRIWLDMCWSKLRS